ncbi:MAG: hypothetical protein HAW62_04795 [Endozoicomonadaceae bacterium]|nr:hypothetical protein [Endozoicomonadaceae bacterium]
MHNTLSFALQHGYTDSFRLLLSHIDTYIQSSSFLLKNTVHALENILFAKHHDTPGLLLACKNGYIEIVRMVFDYIQKLFQREEIKIALGDKLLKILFYTDSQHGTILQTCLEENQEEILKVILTWPGRLDLNSEEKLIIHDWFSFINQDNKTILQYAMSKNHHDGINLLQIFQDNFDQGIAYSTQVKGNTHCRNQAT